MKTIRYFTFLMITLVLLAACQPATSTPEPLEPTATELSAQPTTPATSTPAPTETATIIPTPTLEPTQTATPFPTLDVQVSEPEGPLYEIVFSIPVGEGGVRYRGLGMDEMEITGPTALAALPDGRLIIADLVDIRLLYYMPDGELEKAIDLEPMDIVNVSDLQVAADWLFLTEVFFNISPPRYRVNKLSIEGDLIASYDIPEDFRLADNLPGMIVDGDGRLLLDTEMMGASHEFEGLMPGHIIQLVDPQGSWEPTGINGIKYYDWVFHHYPTTFEDLIAAVIVDDMRVDTDLTFGFGSLRLLGVLPDGQFFLIREDMASDYPAIVVDQTVHFISADGLQLGVARYPLTERLYHVDRAITVGPDGAVYALLPRRNSLDILRLNLFTHLEALVPDAAEPLVVPASP